MKGDFQLNRFKLSPDRIVGKIVLLTGPSNGSGSTMLLAKLEDDGCITTRLPNMFNVMNIRSFRQGSGVMPDVVVKDTVAAFRAGKDLMLKAAFEQVTK